MSALPKTRYIAPEEYLALERRAEYKSEYHDGEIYAMSGASRRHVLISVNIAAQFNSQLRERACEVYSSDLRVRIPRTNSYVYPDVVVICGEPQVEDEAFDTLLNPTLVVEVLSPSTESYDRGEKMDKYFTIVSLREYLLVAQDAPRAWLYTRQSDDSWLMRSFEGLDVAIELESIACRLTLAEVYRKVSFTKSNQENDARRETDADADAETR